ncbi:MAG: hypothetical protein HY262_00560 [Chloroflexi bacterium]|nr:hypothetical protein [Chloroflexota bacterium]
MLDLYGALWIQLLRIGLIGSVEIVAGRRGNKQCNWFVVCLVVSPVAGSLLLALLTPEPGRPHPPV